MHSKHRNTNTKISIFQQHILRWHKKNRRDMPWRHTYDPYKILVSEVMLQQTQIARVLPKYQQFIRTFPTIQSLARAPLPKLLKTWEGLGYWRRARYLQETARMIIKQYGGVFPKNPATLEMLPGIGHYTARAIACFAFQNPDAFIDTNIRRIYLHFFFPNRKNVSDNEILAIAQKAVWKKNPREWHYALFDYGATFLTDKTINKRSRHWHKQSGFEGSFRSFRTFALKTVLASPNHKMAKKTLERLLREELRKARRSYSARKVISSLKKDKLLSEQNGLLTPA